MEFRLAHLPLLCAGILTSLSGCGGSSSGSTNNSNTTASSVSGVAMAGPFKSGQICAYKLDNGILGNQLGCSGFDASSHYAINLGSYQGDVLLAVEAGATYDDEATSGDEVNGTPLTGSLRTIVRVDGGSVVVPVTPLTELLVRLLDTLTSEAMKARADSADAMFPFDAGFDVLTTLPATDNSNAQQMAYREALRALSQLQTAEGMSGDLGSYLEALVNLLRQQDQAALNELKGAMLAAIQENLSEYCSISNNALTCTPPANSGETQELSCDTSKFAPDTQLHLPSSMEMVTFAGPYSGKEGVYSNDYSTFNATGDAQLLLGVDGTAFYNGKSYPLTSICVEDNATYGKMMYLHLGQGELDLFATPFSDGTGSSKWTGTSPADASKTVKGDYVSTGSNGGNNTGGGNTGGGSATGVTFSAPVEGFSSISNSVVTMTDLAMNSLTLINKKGTWGDVTNSVGLVVQYTKTKNPAPGSYYGNSAEIETLSVIVAKGIPVVSAPLDTQGYLCTLTADYPIAKCTDKGISFDRAGGIVSFNAAPMKTVVGSSGSFTVSGSLNFTPF